MAFTSNGEQSQGIDFYFGRPSELMRKLETGTTPDTAGQMPAATAGTPVVMASTAVTAAPSKNTQEYQLLELANGLSKELKHKDAYNAYDKFLKDYPNSALAAEALYGLGYSQYALKNYKSSIASQQKVLDIHADSPKVVDAMMNMANSQIQLGLVRNAKTTLRDLIAKFPSSEVTPTAQKRLKALEAIK